MINGVTTRDGIRAVASPRRQARSPTQSTVRYDRDHPYSWRKALILTPFTSCERHGPKHRPGPAVGSEFTLYAYTVGTAEFPTTVLSLIIAVWTVLGSALGAKEALHVGHVTPEVPLPLRVLAL